MAEQEKNRMITGSINFTKLWNAIQKGHSAAIRGKKTGDIYVNIVTWENDEPDANDNDFGIQLSSTKEAREKGSDEKVYIGNMRRVRPRAEVKEEKETIAAGASGLPEDIPDDLPF